jgi:hypothetical protein
VKQISHKSTSILDLIGVFCPQKQASMLPQRESLNLRAVTDNFDATPVALPMGNLFEKVSISNRNRLGPDKFPPVSGCEPLFDRGILPAKQFRRCLPD